MTNELCAHFSVMMVDDNPLEAELISEAFATIPVHVELETARSGRMALERLGRGTDRLHSTLILISDCLWDMSGVALAKKLIVDLAYKASHVIVLTNKLPSVLQEGVAEHIKKATEWSEWEQLARRLAARFPIEAPPLSVNGLSREG